MESITVVVFVDRMATLTSSCPNPSKRVIGAPVCEEHPTFMLAIGSVDVAVLIPRL